MGTGLNARAVLFQRRSTVGCMAAVLAFSLVAAVSPAAQAAPRKLQVERGEHEPVPAGTEISDQPNFVLKTSLETITCEYKRFHGETDNHIILKTNDAKSDEIEQPSVEGEEVAYRCTHSDTASGANLGFEKITMSASGKASAAFRMQTVIGGKLCGFENPRLKGKNALSGPALVSFAGSVKAVLGECPKGRMSVTASFGLYTAGLVEQLSVSRP